MTRQITDPTRLEWLRDDLDRRGFWDYVDSQPGFSVGPCRCTRRGEPDPNCGIYDHARDPEWCIAANSMRKRCGKAAVHMAPFCGFHMDRAVKAFSIFLDAEAEERRNQEARFDRERYTRRLAEAVELAQFDDARAVLDREGERVYFFTAGDFVKIGRSRNPERRVKNFGTTLAPAGINVQAGELLGTIPGSSRVERELHSRFGRFRAVGEWFRLEPEVADAIAGLLAPRLADTG